MKKLTVIGLLTIFLFNTAGYYIVFKTAQYRIKKEIKKEIKLNLHADELTVIRIPLSGISSINWVEENKEFIYFDQMFDIVKSTSDNFFITYYCINDKQEKTLFQNLENQVLKQVENTKNSKNNSSKKNGDNLVKTYFFEDLSMVVFQNSFRHLYPGYNRSFSAVEIFVHTPPPRL